MRAVEEVRTVDLMELVDLVVETASWDRYKPVIPTAHMSVNKSTCPCSGFVRLVKVGNRCKERPRYFSERMERFSIDNKAH